MGVSANFSGRSDGGSWLWPVLLALVAGLGTGFGVRDQMARSATPARQSEPAEPEAPSAPSETSLASETLEATSRRVAAAVSPMVVRLDVQRDAGKWSDSSFPGPADANRELPTTEQGTAIVLAADGKLLTNYHLIQFARRIRVAHESLKEAEATVIGVDAPSDLAVLQVDAVGLKPVVWSERSPLAVGEFVWAVGYPFGLQRSVSFGVLSAINDQPPARLGLPFGCLQTDAAMNPGSSGGPLVDATGSVIGINTAIVGNGFQGIGFAIPAHVARGVVTRLLRSPTVGRGWLGGTFEDDLSGNEAAPAEPTAGAVRIVGFIDKAGATSPLKMAGAMPGDLVAQWNDQPVESAWALERRVAEATPGDVVRLHLRRDGQVVSIDVVVGDSR